MKKTYTKPELIVHGKIEEITKGGDWDWDIDGTQWFHTAASDGS